MANGSSWNDGTAERERWREREKRRRKERDGGRRRVPHLAHGTVQYEQGQAQQVIHPSHLLPIPNPYGSPSKLEGNHLIKVMSYASQSLLCGMVGVLKVESYFFGPFSILFIFSAFCVDRICLLHSERAY